MTRLIVVIGFAIAFGAGLMLGHVWDHAGHEGPGGPHGHPDSWFAQQLDLSADQQVKMKQVWSDVSHRGGPQMGAKRAELRRDQEAAIAKLVRPEDQATYDKIVSGTKAKMDALDNDSRRQFQQAVEKTKQLLTPAQRTKYEKLMEQRPWERGDKQHTEHPGGPASRPE